MQLKKEPLEGIRVTTAEDNMLDVTGIIEGPGMLSILKVIASVQLWV